MAWSIYHISDIEAFTTWIEISGHLLYFLLLQVMIKKKSDVNLGWSIYYILLSHYGSNILQVEVLMLPFPIVFILIYILQCYICVFTGSILSKILTGKRLLLLDKCIIILRFLNICLLSAHVIRHFCYTWLEIAASFWNSNILVIS